MKDEDKGEGWCDDCGQEYPIWFAPNKVWRVIHQQGMLCPNCFMRKAEKDELGRIVWIVKPDKPTLWDKLVAFSFGVRMIFWRVRGELFGYPSDIYGLQLK